MSEQMVVFPQYNYESDAYRVAVALDDESTYDIREVIDTETGDEIDAITLGQRLAAEYGYRYVTEWKPAGVATVQIDYEPKFGMVHSIVKANVTTAELRAIEAARSDDPYDSAVIAIDNARIIEGGPLHTAQIPAGRVVSIRVIDEGF